MPRSRSIPWGERVAIFLDYRRLGGKVQPAAKRHGHARSTVAAIVAEFVSMGFSSQPRPSVSPEFLVEMHARHLLEVVGKLQHPFSLAGGLARPIGLLDMEPPMSDEAATANPLVLDDELAWHLKGTDAEKVVIEARQAATDYRKKWRTLWNDLSAALAQTCGLPIRPRSDAVGQANIGPCIFRELVSLIYREFFNYEWRAQAPPPNWPSWSNPDDGPRLRANNEEIASGTKKDHEKVKRGVAAFVRDRFVEFQGRVFSLEALHRDLRYVNEIVQAKLASVAGADVVRGVCPDCPYPEADSKSRVIAEISNIKIKEAVTNERQEDRGDLVPGFDPGPAGAFPGLPRTGGQKEAERGGV